MRRLLLLTLVICGLLPIASAGAVISIAGALLVAVSTAFHQSFTKSAGGMEQGGLDAIDSAAREASKKGTALIIAQHHPPKGHALPPTSV